jgi:Amiloride-sensitive sodium channel
VWIFACSSLGYLLNVTINEFLEGKIILELSRNEVSVADIPFPAVTICPQILSPDYLPTQYMQLIEK